MFIMVWILGGLSILLWVFAPKSPWMARITAAQIMGCALNVFVKILIMFIPALAFLKTASTIIYSIGVVLGVSKGENLISRYNPNSSRIIYLLLAGIPWLLTVVVTGGFANIANSLH